MESDIITTICAYNININICIIINKYLVTSRNFETIKKGWLIRMNQLGDYKGLCPLCYKPVKQEDESREIMLGTRTEFYHASCLHDYVRKNSDETNTPSIGLSLLEQYKQLIIGNDPEKREAWLESQSVLWGAQGQVIKEMREHFECSISYVAKELGISVARMKRFEAGKPIRDANLLQQAFYLWVFGENLKRHYNNLHNHVHGTDYFKVNGTNIYESLIDADQKKNVGIKMPQELSNTEPPDYLAFLIKEMKSNDVASIQYIIDENGLTKISYFYRYDLDTLDKNNGCFTAILLHSTTTNASQTEIIDIYGGTFNAPTRALRDYYNGLISSTDLSAQYIINRSSIAPTNDAAI